LEGLRCRGGKAKGQGHFLEVHLRGWEEVSVGILNMDLKMSAVKVGFEYKVIVEREGLPKFMKESWMPDLVKRL
jgi:hypothetical protein